MTPHEESIARWHELVAVRREELGLNSARKLADATGVSDKIFDRAARERSLPNIKAMCAMAKALGIDLEYVLAPMLE